MKATVTKCIEWNCIVGVDIETPEAYEQKIDKQKLPTYADALKLMEDNGTGELPIIPISALNVDTRKEIINMVATGDYTVDDNILSIGNVWLGFLTMEGHNSMPNWSRYGQAQKLSPSVLPKHELQNILSEAFSSEYTIVVGRFTKTFALDEYVPHIASESMAAFAAESGRKDIRLCIDSALDAAKPTEARPATEHNQDAR